jgi:hypothetical protein
MGRTVGGLTQFKILWYSRSIYYMNDLLKKLNFKDQKEILILNAPEDFAPYLKEIKMETGVATEFKAGKEYSFVIAFVKTQKEVNTLAPKMNKALGGDGLLWMAYPKGTSKKYKSEISRDQGWDPLRALGFDTVRLIAINDDWSCMRFRREEFIKR